MLSIGDKYLDYTVTAFIGRGGMGTVLKLEKSGAAGEQAALKILHPHLLDDEELVQRFYLEAEVAGRIESPRVCKVFDVRQVSLGEKPTHAILMEYVEGESLADLMEDREAFGEEWALHVADGVLEALEAIHSAGLLHRDIKPENIVITTDNSVKVLDLGLAKVMESSIKLSKTGYFIGTYHYASPEQLTGDDLDYSCDIYSLGIVLYELTTASRPHTSGDIRELIYEKVNVPVRPPSRLNPTLSPFFDMLVLDMLAIKLSERLRTASRCREIIEMRERSDWYRARLSDSVSRESLSQSASLRRLVRVPRRTALYGRSQELAALESWARQALGMVEEQSEEGSTAKGMAVFVGGEAGIGKTRLVEELAGKLEALDRPHVVLLGRSLSERRHVPYAPLLEMVRNFFMLEEEPEIDLVELFSEYIPNLRPLIPPFLELVTHRRYLDDSGIRGVLNESNLLHLFQTLFGNIAKEVPLMLFFDDLQWADVNTISVLGYLAAGLGDGPLMIIGTYREEELRGEDGEPHPLEGLIARLSGKPLIQRIRLGRLKRDACLQIVDECFPAATFVESLADRLYEKSEGNPFFLMEIINLLADEEKVRFSDGRWRLESEIAKIEIPPSLRDIVAFRLERLSEQEREVLEAASILGYRFTSDLLVRLTDLARIKLLRILQKLEKARRLVIGFEAGYRFDHHVVYETVYDGILPELRTEYHRLTADILSETGDIEAAVYRLVYHLRRAGEDERALVFLPMACMRARSEYSNHLALEHSGWAWEAYERLGRPETHRRLVTDLMAERCEVAGILGKREIELESARRMLELAEDLDDPVRTSIAHRLMGEFSRHVSDFDQALAHCERALELCPDESGPARAAILREMAAAKHLKGEDEEAVELYEQALRALEQASPGLDLVKTHNNLGISLKRQNRTEEAVQEFQKAYELAGELGDLHAETFPLGSLALIHKSAGRWEEAHGHFLKLLNVLEQTGDVVSRARTLLNQGNIFYEVGLYEQAEAHFSESLAARRRMDDRLGEAVVLHHLAHVHCERGDYEKSLELLTEAMTIHQEIGDVRGEAETLGVLARIHNLDGRHKVALDCSNRALEIGRTQGSEGELIEAEMEGVAARLGLGERGEALAGKVTELVDKAGMERLISRGPRALYRLMELQEACGLKEGAARSLEAARGIVEDILSRLSDPEWRASYRRVNQRKEAESGED